MALQAIARAAGARARPHLGFACLLACGLLAGCASSQEAAKVLNPDPPAKMFAFAEALLTNGSYRTRQEFEELDRDHLCAQARRAVVMAAYASTRWQVSEE